MRILGKLHPMSRIAHFLHHAQTGTEVTPDSQDSDVVRRFLAQHPEVKAANEAVTASWDRAIGAVRLAVLNNELAESGTHDCCDHMEQSSEFLASAGECSAMMTSRSGNGSPVGVLSLF